MAGSTNLQLADHLILYVAYEKLSHSDSNDSTAPGKRNRRSGQD